MAKLTATSKIAVTDEEKELIENAYPQYEKVILEKEFGGGFSETRVFLVLPIKASGATDARLVTKIGAAANLQCEKDNYDQFIKPALPFTAAQVTGCYSLGDQAAIHYAFAGGGAMGQTPSLEDYYLTQPAEAINQTLNALLDKTLGETWYGQHKPHNELFREQYEHHLPPHEKLLEIVSAIYPQLRVVDGKRVQIPGVAGIYPDPLLVYPKLLDRTLSARKSFVHGDLHVRNVLVDETGKAWLIDFAKVKERHNLFDFIKLETYIRLMALAQIAGAFSLNDYAQFEQALNKHTAPPTNPELTKAYRVIQNIREIAQKYMGHQPNFENEYFPALFLYSLSMLKYFHINGPLPTQLMFMTSCATAATIFDDLSEQTMKPVTHKNESTPKDTKEKRPTGGISIGGNATANVIVSGDHNKVSQKNVRQNNVNTGGGAYVGGNVRVTNGDYVGRDKITNQYGATSTDEVAAVFKQFLQQIEAMQNTPGKPSAKMAVQGLETENKNGEQATEETINSWFTLLSTMAPAIYDVVVDSLASPIKGLSTIIQKIAIHLKETHKK